MCTKGNQNEASGGRIGFYSQTADSAIEGNQQYDTSGINLGLKYSVADSAAGTVVGLNLYSFVDVRSNTVNGEYDWNLEDNTLVFANTLSNISGPAAQTRAARVRCNHVAHGDVRQFLHQCYG